MNQINPEIRPPQNMLRGMPISEIHNWTLGTLAVPIFLFGGYHLLKRRKNRKNTGPEITILPPDTDSKQTQTPPTKSPTLPVISNQQLSVQSPVTVEVATEEQKKAAEKDYAELIEMSPLELLITYQQDADGLVTRVKTILNALPEVDKHELITHVQQRLRAVNLKDPIGIGQRLKIQTALTNFESSATDDENKS